VRGGDAAVEEQAEEGEGMLKDSMEGFIKLTLLKVAAFILGAAVLGGWIYVMWLMIAALRKYVNGG